MRALQFVVTGACVIFYLTHGTAQNTFSSSSCAYIVRASSDVDTFRNDRALSRLETTVMEQQKQLTALLQQINQLTEDNAYWRQRANIDKGQQNEQGSRGSTYIRWGRTVCNTNASLVYAGYAAGSLGSQTGGMTDLLCLPKDPGWGRYVDGRQGGSYIFGTEYKTSIYTTGNDPFLKHNANGESLNNHDVPCALCYAPGKTTVELFPAKLQCPDGWTQEYHGYLMSQHYTQTRLKALCVDEAPEVIPSGQGNANGALLYNVEARCGSLPCPDYHEGRELTCSLCSR